MTRKRSHDRKCTSFGRIMHWSSYGILFYKDSGDCRGDINGGTFISAGMYGNRLFVSGYRYRIFDNQPQITQISKICMQIYRTSDGDAQLSFPTLFSIIGYLLWAASPLIAYSIICFAMGYLFHLIQDSFTKGGIPWMYPIKRYRFHLLPMRSGSLFQWPIVFVLVFAYSEILNYFLIPD